MELAAERHAAEWEEPLARVGLSAKGVSYALVGVLAIGVALGIGGKSTSRSGATQPMARSSWRSLPPTASSAGRSPPRADA